MRHSSSPSWMCCAGRACGSPKPSTPVGWTWTSRQASWRWLQGWRRPRRRGPPSSTGWCRGCGRSRTISGPLRHRLHHDLHGSTARLPAGRNSPLSARKEAPEGKLGSEPKLSPSPLRGLRTRIGGEWTPIHKTARASCNNGSSPRGRGVGHASTTRPLCSMYATSGLMRSPSTCTAFRWAIASLMSRSARTSQQPRDPAARH